MFCLGGWRVAAICARVGWLLPSSSLLEWDAMDDYGEYDDYEPSCFEKFQDKFLYSFIPTLCLMFDASFITVGLICLAGADDDFDKCSGDGALTSIHLPSNVGSPGSHLRRAVCSLPAVDAETLSESDLSENEIAGKVAGPPCMCQKAPLSALAMLLLGLFLLAVSRIPPYLNRDKHMLQLVRVLAPCSIGSAHFVAKKCIGAPD